MFCFNFSASSLAQSLKYSLTFCDLIILNYPWTEQLVIGACVLYCYCLHCFIVTLPLSLLHSLLHYLYWVTLVRWHNVSCVLDILKFKHLKFASNISENAMSPSELNIELKLRLTWPLSTATPVIWPPPYRDITACKIVIFIITVIIIVNRHHNCQSSS